LNGLTIRQFLRGKNWLDTNGDWRYVNEKHPYVIISSEEEGQVSLREISGDDNGQNGEQIFSFRSLEQLQEWFENNIGE
jgi:hypothetical protein